jgi:BlaI family transcriptional regulator, penicillinase repressor
MSNILGLELEVTHMEKKIRIELTEAEWAIIKAIWEKEPCAAPAVQEALAGSKGWAYSTVRTLMDRMAAKGLLKAKKVGHLTVFQSEITPKQAQRSELLYALKNAFNGALTPMVQGLLETGKVSEQEMQELETMIRNLRAESEKEPNGQ